MLFRTVSAKRYAVSVMILIPLLGVIVALSEGIVRNFEVTSSSMRPTLETGDWVFMKRKNKDYQPARGQIIVLASPQNPGELLAKRVIGIPGDEIVVYRYQLFVNGEKQEEAYVEGENKRVKVNNLTLTVPAGEIFVLGDNRNFSYDSLNFGTVPIDSVEGLLTYRYWPPGRMGAIE